MPDQQPVWKDHINGVLILTEIISDDLVMVSRWCHESEEYVESCVCKRCDFDVVVQRMTKKSPGTVKTTTSSRVGKPN